MADSMIPYSFIPGTKAKAGEVNANFIALADAIENNRQAATGDIEELNETLETKADKTELITSHTVTDAGTDLNNYKTDGTYIFSSLYTPYNIPKGASGVLIVTGLENSAVKQIWFCDGDNPEIYTRKLISKIEDETLVDVVYPALELKSKTSEGQLFHKSDTHWNLLGAKVGFVSLMKNMERLRLIGDFHEIPLMDLKQIKNEKLGDLAHILALPSDYKITKDFDYVFQHPDHLFVKWQEANKKEEQKPFTVSSGSAPSKFYAYMKNESAVYRTKLLVFCDSFNNAMSPCRTRCNAC